MLSPRSLLHLCVVWIHFRLIARSRCFLPELLQVLCPSLIRVVDCLIRGRSWRGYAHRSRRRTCSTRAAAASAEWAWAWEAWLATGSEVSSAVFDLSSSKLCLRLCYPALLRAARCAVLRSLTSVSFGKRQSCTHAKSFSLLVCSQRPRCRWLAAFRSRSPSPRPCHSVGCCQSTRSLRCAFIYLGNLGCAFEPFAC